MGDSLAFDKLFAQYGNRLFYFAKGYLKSNEDAEGVVQEVFLRIWRNRKKLKPELSFKAYLFKITYHCILEVFKHNNSRQSFLHQVASDSIHFTQEIFLSALDPGMYFYSLEATGLHSGRYYRKSYSMVLLEE